MHSKFRGDSIQMRITKSLALTVMRALSFQMFSLENTQELLRKKSKLAAEIRLKIDWRQYVAFLTFPIGTLDNPEGNGAWQLL